MANIDGTNNNDNLVGNDEDDVIQGFDGNDFLDGVGGSDRLLGGAGSDTHTGGDGADEFVYDRLGGSDTITDFTQGEDVIDLRSIGISQFSRISENPPSTIFDLGGDESVSIEGVQYP